MQSLTTNLLTGPYDWDQAALPQQDFDARTAALRAAMREAGNDVLVIHGNSIEYGALSWATNFTPKLGAAFFVLPLERAPCVLFAGGGGMAESAGRLTWVGDVRAIGNPARDLSAALGASARLALGGLAMMSQGSFEALGGRPWSDLDPAIAALRRRKSAVEQGLIAEATAVLRSTAGALCAAHAAGQGMRAAGLAAEQAAYRAGAQDVRVLASHRRFGPPLDDLQSAHLAQALAWVGVRRRGYWACCDLTLGQSAALEAARAALRDALAAPEGTLIGTAPDEGPSGKLQPGDAVVLRVHHRSGTDVAALSALLLADGNAAPWRVLWPEDLA